jgi:ketosteroid isomerase-like protein
MKEAANMQDTRETIAQHWAAGNARDWPRFAAVIHENLVYEVPQTRERVRGRDAYVEFFRTWPGDWRADVRRMVVDGNSAVTEIAFVVDGETMTGISFFELIDGTIARIIDYWPSPYEPPARMTAVIERY